MTLVGKICRRQTIGNEIRYKILHKRYHDEKSKLLELIASDIGNIRGITKLPENIIQKYGARKSNIVWDAIMNGDIFGNQDRFKTIELMIPPINKNYFGSGYVKVGILLDTLRIVFDTSSQADRIKENISKFMEYTNMNFKLPTQEDLNIMYDYTTSTFSKTIKPSYCVAVKTAREVSNIAVKATSFYSLNLLSYKALSTVFPYLDNFTPRILSNPIEFINKKLFFFVPENLQIKPSISAAISTAYTAVVIYSNFDDIYKSISKISNAVGEIGETFTSFGYCEDHTGIFSGALKEYFTEEL